jgi:hypothetical protein
MFSITSCLNISVLLSWTPCANVETQNVTAGFIRRSVSVSAYSLLEVLRRAQASVLASYDDNLAVLCGRTGRALAATPNRFSRVNGAIDDE